MASSEPEIYYKPGALRKIKLVNFMCHESFEQEFGPRVSFIIGPNGSGKSALLTALMVALGGRATLTSRAKKTSDFVMYGKKFAKITVVLQNYEKIMDKDNGFRPDDYGKLIIIEKEIYREIHNNKDESSKMKLTLRNYENKKVSERKAELDEMLEHFGILINNPICILNQEVSKTFLHSKKPEDQYDLFMKATTLETIENEYQQCRELHGSWEDTNKRGTVGFKLLDQEYAKCKEKTKAIEDRNKFHKQLSDLQLELYWAYVTNDEVACEELKKQIDVHRSEIAASQEEIKKREGKLKNYEEDKQELTDKNNVSLARVEETRKKVIDVESKITASDLDRVTKNEAVKRCEKYLHRLNSERKNYEKSITEIKRLLSEQNALDQDEEKRKSDIELLEKTIQSLDARIISIDNEIAQKRASLTEKMKDQYTLQTNTRDLENRIFTSTNRLKRLTSGKENSILKYGEHCQKLIEKIEQHHKAHPRSDDDPDCFAYKPLGPVGFHIKLKDPAIANPLEIHLGRNAHAFICDNTNDMRILNKLCDQVLNHPRLPKPPIIVRKFRKKHDVSVHKTTHDTFKTLLDYLDIDEAPIFNICLDRCSLENVLYIPEYNVAQNMLMNSSLVPANLKAAYTSDCYIMFPTTSNGGYRSYHNDTSKLVLFSKADNHAIAETQQHIEELKVKFADAKNQYERFFQESSSQKKTLEDCVKQRNRLELERREKKDELSNLKLVIPMAKPTELEGLEQDLENCLNLIAAQDIELIKVQKELDEVDRELAEYKSQLKECEIILRDREKTRIQIAKEIEKTNDNIEDANLIIRNKQNIIEKRQNDLAELEPKLKAAYEELEQSIVNAPNGATKPRVIRSAETIKDEVERVNHRIRLIEDDEMDPEEVLRNLRKRMSEIENMTEIKNSNLSNFKLMSNSILDREIGFKNLKNNTISAVSTTFARIMRSMNMGGELKIYMEPLMERGHVVKKGKTLEINIETNYLPNSQRVNSTIPIGGDLIEPSHQSQPDLVAPSRAKRARTDQDLNISGKENAVPALKNMTNTRSLSGGERSFSTVALVLSLWQHCASPFKLMDEIDVFMDMVTRRISYNALIRFAQCSDKPGQYIFFSPLELPKFDDPHSMVKVFVMPTIIRKDQSSLPPPT